MPPLDDIWKWLDLRNWPFVVWFWLGIVIAGNIPAMWRWYRQRHALVSWAIASANIEVASYSEPASLREFLSTKRKNGYIARLDYTYVVEGQRYTGNYQRSFPSEVEAANFVRKLEGGITSIRFNPRTPSRSLLPTFEIEQLLANRPELPELGTLARVGSVSPDWLRRFLWPLVILAASGLVISISVHIGTYFGRQILPPWCFVALHAGIFVVFFPAVFLANEAGINNSTEIFRDSPEWMRVMTQAFGVYALVNFAIFFIAAQGYPKHGVPDALEWRGFSGHWMLFYSAALSLLYPATHRPDDACTTRVRSSRNSAAE